MRDHWIIRFLCWLRQPQVSRMAMMVEVGLCVLLLLLKVRWITGLVGWFLLSGGSALG